MKSESVQKSDLENKALKKATIEKLYQDKMDQIERQEDNKTEIKDHNSDRNSSIIKILSILYNPKKQGDYITDFETKPKMPDNIDKVIKMKSNDINKIRFEIGDKYNTKWYNWNSEELDNVIKYYANEDISEFISNTKINYISNLNRAEISMPNNFNSRSSRFKNKIDDRIRLIDNQINFYRIKSITNCNIGELTSFFTFYTFVLLVYLLFSFTPYTNITLMSVLVLGMIHLIIGSIISEKITDVDKDYEYTPETHYIAVFKPIIYPIYKIFQIIYYKIDRIEDN